MAFMVQPVMVVLASCAHTPEDDQITPHCPLFPAGRSAQAPAPARPRRTLRALVSLGGHGGSGQSRRLSLSSSPRGPASGWD